MSLLDYKSFLNEMRLYEKHDYKAIDKITFTDLENSNLIEFFTWAKQTYPNKFFPDNIDLVKKAFIKKTLTINVPSSNESKVRSEVADYAKSKGWKFTPNDKAGHIDIEIPYPDSDKFDKVRIRDSGSYGVETEAKNKESKQDKDFETLSKGSTLPTNLGIASDDTLYKDAKSLLDKLTGSITANTNFTESLKKWLINLAEATAQIPSSNKSVKDWFANPEVVKQTVKIPDFPLDTDGKNEVAKNYGEVLDAIFLLSYFTVETGLKIPAKANEPLVDLYIDGYHVSAKESKGGGSPSIKTIVERIILQNMKFKDPDEQTLADILKQPLVVKATSETSFGVFDSYFSIAESLAAKHLQEMPAFTIFKDYVASINPGIKFVDKDKKALESLFDEKDKEAKDENYIEFLQSVFKAAEYKPAGFNPAKPKNSFNYLFIALCKEIGEVLNNNYQEAFQGICNQTINMKQGYLKVDLKNDTLEFEFYSSQNLKAVFNTSKSIPTSPYNAALSFSLKKK